MHRRISTLSLLVAAIAGIASADTDVNENLEQLAGDAATGYLKPIISSLGSNLNQGWFNQSPRPVKFGIDLATSVYFVGTKFASSADEFSAKTSLYVDQNLANTLGNSIAQKQAKERNISDTAMINASARELAAQLHGKTFNVTVGGPTIIGSDDDHVSYTFGSSDDVPEDVQGQSAELPVTGLDLAGFVGMPLVIPQVTVGTVYGTMATLRYLPEAGGFSFWGIGLNHNPGVWREDGNFLPFGINSSVTFAYSSLGFGDYMDFTAWNLGLMASKRVGFRFLNITPYAGLGIERSTLSVSYDTPYLGPDGKAISVSVEESGENLFRMTLGTGLRLGILNFDAGYTIAKYSSANFGLHLAF